MKLIKTTFFSGLTTFVKIVTGFVSTKIVAILIGASGVAIIGAFYNFLSIILAFGNGGINNGIVKYTAEYLEDKNKIKSLFSTSLIISVCSSLIVGILLTCFCKTLSKLIFVDDSYYKVILALSFTLIFYSLNSLLISILNGQGQIRLLTIVNMLGSIVGLGITVMLVSYYKVYGALYALILSQTLIFFVSLAFVFSRSSIDINLFKGKFDVLVAKKLSSFTLMAIVSAVTVPISQLILRNIIIHQFDITNAGIWQGMMRISDGYLMVINIALATYYLPKLSSINNNNDLRHEVLQGYKIIIPLVLLMSLLIYFSRFFIIQMLYSSGFDGMESLFFWQLLGDLFKIASYILAYLMLAKAMTKVYIITEIVFSISYILFSYFFVLRFGIKGAAVGFALNYFCYLIVFILLFRKLLFSGK